MDKTTRSREKGYAAEKYSLTFAGIAADLVFLVLFQVYFADRIASAITSGNTVYFRGVLIFATAMSICHFVFTLPLSLYRGYFLEHKYSLSNQKISAWVKDTVKHGVLGLGFFLFMAALFYAILRTAGQYWWIAVAVAWSAFEFIFVRIMPTLIIPIFYKYKGILDKDLKSDLFELAKKAGVKLIDVFEIDISRKTKKANAAIVGMGGSRRMLLSDTLLANFNRAEVAAVCAHEMAHHKMGHLPKLMVFSCAAQSVGFYLMSIAINDIAVLFHVGSLADIRLMPSLMLFLYIWSLVVMPVQNMFSRKIEAEADRMAIELTGDPAGFVSMMDGLARMNLADREPPKFIKFMFYDHPTISERVRFAEGIKIKR